MSDSFRVSFFRGLKLTWPRVESISLRDLAGRIAAARADHKADLPMLKLGVFEGGAKRENLKTLSGAMLDYDAGEVSIDEAADRLRDAGVVALLYSSPSSTVESPRWRVLAPYRRDVGPVEHQDLTDRVNGALGGIIDDAASWETQQRFYYGQAKYRDAKKGGGDADKIEIIITEGDPIDTLEIEPAPRPARAKAARDDSGDLGDLLGDDEDDLFDLVRTSPLGLTEDEIDGFLADIPNAGDGIHYDDYVNVGMAIHHEYSGSAEGFEKFCEWAEQSVKFDLHNAKGRWRSFNKESKSPRTFRSIIQEANANRAAASAAKLASDLGLDDFDLPAERTNLPAVISQGDLDDLLGGDTPPAAKAAANVKTDPDWLHKLHRNEEGELKSSLPNIALIMDNDPRLAGLVAYNEFKQMVVLRGEPRIASKKRESAHDPVNLKGRLWKIEDTLNGDNWTDSHDIAVRNLIETKTQMKGYGIKVTDRDLNGGVDLSAQRRAFHPVKEAIEAVTWDGKPRAETLFIDYLGCDNNNYYRQCALMTLVGAITRIYRPGHKFDFVPILEGAQGKGKSTFIEVLGLNWYNELTGDIRDPKQMIESMQGTWILEIGELSAMHRSEVNDLKAFVTRTHDKGRLAWMKRVREFPRQCIFMGSTNDREYLRDRTGGRRFWPIVCRVDGQIDNLKLREEILQVWAEALHIYRQMEKQYPGKQLPLYLTDEAALIALEMQESRRVETSEDVLSGKIGAWLDTPIGADFDDLEDAPKIYRDETCIQQIWEEMMGRDGSVPHTDTIKIGAAMLALGWPRSKGPVITMDINRKYGKCRVYTRPSEEGDIIDQF
ncbi:VapE domain-containing protein [Manganibacter manganicus]|uniref:Uncharacterized protein n=1 Tax=Manganibacter manganicus TaxID=1873176 RepID=A0A1V8RP15_9HYPH|nr:VapE domain-containing protein [Pseudaminobacter manganicus]OQM74926.1 hypothetical protein BFN67_04745 [Pseudaminobacter manganicus]